MFAGRERELEELEILYKTNTFQMVIIYGRRRIGKSTLIARFTENKRSVFLPPSNRAQSGIWKHSAAR